MVPQFDTLDGWLEQTDPPQEQIGVEEQAARRALVLAALAFLVLFWMVLHGIQPTAPLGPEN